MKANGNDVICGNIPKFTSKWPRGVLGVGLDSPACWDFGFESRRGFGCLSHMSVVCCQVKIFLSV
jgi:hypothetical protein